MNSEICTKRYYVYNEVIAGIEIVRDYIRETKQILVGGQSIDYALRLKGVQLYENWEIPDFDFITDDYAKVAYEIFSKVTSIPTDVSVLNALHPTTMRVQVMKFSVADVTFIPTRLMEIYRLSALEYDGCFIRHPFFQYLDIQRSFSYPYENPMMEVITHRWEKDYKRLLLTMKYYNPNDSKLVDDFISGYLVKQKANLQKLGSKKNRLHMMSKNKNKISANIKQYKNKGILEKPVLTFGVINGELAFMIYYDIYRKVIGKPPSNPYLSGNEQSFSYTGSDDFLNSYLMTPDDQERFFAHYPKVEIKETNAYIDVIPSRLIGDIWELVNVEHKTAYHDINLKMLNDSYPNITVKVVSINYLTLYISMLWITLRANVYLSIFIKLLKIIEKIYNLQEDTPLIRLLYPSIKTYGKEVPHIFDRNKVVKPPNIYVNKYNPVDKALESIKPFEYSELYNLDGM